MAAASVRPTGALFLCLSLSLALLATAPAAALSLSTGYYDRACPALQPAVRAAVARAVAADPRAGASVLRLFFHDCFVNGCDASVLLDDGGEKAAAPNLNSLRGFDVVDAAKAAADAACPRAAAAGVVSCADVLALAARDAVALLGGPAWAVRLGRKDARTASAAAAEANLPGPGSSASSLLAAFAAKGLSARDMTALSGAHTVGRARCATFRARANAAGAGASAGDAASSVINATFAAQLRAACPTDASLAALDAETPDAFDNGYFRALVQRRGLLHSDQELYGGGGGPQEALVRRYAADPALFAGDFARAMVRMGNLAPAPGTPLEVRINCRRPN